MCSYKYTDLHKIYYGHRHCHCTQAINEELSYNLNRKEIASFSKIQGFMTTNNRFVNRKKAMIIVKEAEQISDLTLHEFNLFTEDLY